jgi:hypothetical protein
MNHDEIIKEVRTLREQLAARKGYDVRALYEEAKKRQQESDRKVVKLAPRLLESIGERTG